MVRNKITALQTDFYELTMSAAYFFNNMNKVATFSLFVRDLPPQRNYIIASGLEYVVKYLERFSFNKKEISYLRSLNMFKEEFLQYLNSIHFTGNLWAVPEGTICFPKEPILEITSPIIEAQLIETSIIQIINLHSTLTTKAARCKISSKDKSCIDFSLRRCQGSDAGFAAARAAATVGFIGTSNVDAARILGIKPVGTMAHSFIEAFGDETKAFKAFSELFPNKTITLIDTYNNQEGIQKSIKLAKILSNKGYDLIGIRLDSGDLISISLEAKRMLKKANLSKVKIIASGNLDEYYIEKISNKKNSIDSLAIGTKMGSSSDAPYLNLTYKLVAYDKTPTLKLSSGKESLVMPKQIWRQINPKLTMLDTISLREEQYISGFPLLKPFMYKGHRLKTNLSWKNAQKIFKSEIKITPNKYLQIKQPAQMAIDISPQLKEIQNKTRNFFIKTKLKNDLKNKKRKNKTRTSS